MLSVLKLRLLRLRDEFWVYVIMMAMSFGFTMVFGYSFNDYKPYVLIVDEDQTRYSEYLSEELSGFGGFRFAGSDRENAAKMVGEGKVLAAVLIESGFETAVIEEKTVRLGLVKTKDDMMILTLKHMLSSAASRMTGAVRISEIAADYVKSKQPAADREAVKAGVYRSVLEAWEYKKPIEIKSVAANTGADSGYDNLKHSMIGFSLFFSMYGIVFGIGTILNDRQYKTWQRMMIAPVSKAAILGGSMTVTFVAGLLQLVILVLAGKYLLSIDWGSSITGMLLIALAFVFSITSLGLLLSGIVKTSAQLAAVTPVLLTSTSMLGGCMWPLDIVSNKALLFLAELTPQKWAVQGMEDIAARGMGFEAAAVPVLVLTGMGLLFFAIGVRLVKYE